MRRAILTALAVVGLVGLVVATWFYASLSGGLDDAFRRKKTAGSSDVRAARRQAEPVVDKTAAALRLPFGEPREECREGQHNWKVDDDYDVQCDLVRVAPVDSDPKSLRALHEQLQVTGWQADAGIPAALDAGSKGARYRRADGPAYDLNVEWYDTGRVTLRYEFFRG